MYEEQIRQENQEGSRQRVHSVSELTQVIKRTLEHTFPYIWVKGEITNLTRASSGHIYFSLKDEHALLPCVWYKNQQNDLTFDPLTGEVFEEAIPSLAKSLEHGSEMLFSGSLNVYPPRGAYQFIVDRAEELGQGNLHKAFEKLKKKLLSLGWFNQEHKKALPKNPRKIAVLTSPQGAVIHDFCRIASQYGLSSKIHIYPIAVQGAEAIPSIVQAFRQVHKENWAEVIVLIRGGGSLEDLWAFNEEEVAKAIFESKIPVITGIGHQVDTSIADFVADVSAATPSHVVSYLWKEREIYVQEIDELEENIKILFKNSLQRKAEKLAFKAKHLNMLSPLNKLNLQEEKLKQKIKNLHAASSFVLEKERLHSYQVRKLLPFAEKIIDKKSYKIDHLQALLEAHNPYMPLEKGYTLAYELDEQNNPKLLTSSQVSCIKNEIIKKIMLEFKDGKTLLEVSHIEKFK